MKNPQLVKQKPQTAHSTVKAQKLNLSQLDSELVIKTFAKFKLFRLYCTCRRTRRDFEISRFNCRISYKKCRSRHEARRKRRNVQQVPLLLGENLARLEAGYTAFYDHNRRGRRLHNRSCGESFRQRHRGSGRESNHYHVDRLSWRAVHEYAEAAYPALNRGQPDLRACHPRL